MHPLVTEALMLLDQISYENIARPRLFGGTTKTSISKAKHQFNVHFCKKKTVAPTETALTFVVTSSMNLLISSGRFNDEGSAAEGHFVMFRENLPRAIGSNRP